MEKRNNSIKQNITQVALIVFSVVLGLYLNQGIEERKNKLDSDNLLALIKSEVSDNVQLMKKSSLYHKKMFRNLDSLCKNEVFIAEFIKDKTVLFEKLFTNGSFQKRFPASDAWDIAKAHPLIANFDYDKLLILSKIYKQQKSTFENMQERFGIFSSKKLNQKEDAKSNLEFIRDSLRELVARENQLLQYYKEAEEILDLQNE